MQTDKKINVWFIFGGASPEYEVSCHSAAGLIAGIDRNKYEVHQLGITKEGQWFYTKAGPDEIGDAVSWLKDPGNRPAVLCPDRGSKMVLIFGENGVFALPVDVVFPVIHGETGEDGTLQGFLELVNVPYVGSGVFASSCAMDKTLTAEFIERLGIKGPKMFSADKADFKADPDKVTLDAETYHNGTYPVVVKPSMTGSSVGVSVAKNRAELKAAMEQAAAFKGRIMVEEFIKGREMKVAVLGTEKITLGAVCETAVEHGDFNSFDLKYRSNGSHQRIPAPVPPEIYKQIQEDAVTVFKGMRCAGLARVDFFLRGDEIIFNEINTMPGIAQKSIFPRMLDKVGVCYPDMIDILIEDALSRTE